MKNQKAKILFYLLLVLHINLIFPTNQIDTTFATNGIVISEIALNDYINSVDLQSNNYIIVTGFFTSMSKLIKLGVARFDTSGVLDPNFNSTGLQKALIGSRTEGNAIANQSDDNIVVAGLAIQSQANFVILRFLGTNGQLDTSFNTVGYLTVSIGAGAQANTVKIQSDGNIVAAGVAVTGSPRFALVRCDTNGVLDSSFGSGGIVTTEIGFQSSINQIAIQSDGKIVAVGYVFDGATINFVIARYNGTDGSVDTSFGSSGFVSTSINSESAAKSVAIQTDGKIVVAGYTVDSGFKKFAIVRYHGDISTGTPGTLDTSFGTGGIVITSIQDNAGANAVALQTDGQIIAAGFSMGDTATNFALARYNSTDGSLDTSYGINGIQLTNIGGVGSDSEINSIVIQPADDKCVTAGFTTNESADANFAVARYVP